MTGGGGGGAATTEEPLSISDEEDVPGVVGEDEPLEAKIGKAVRSGDCVAGAASPGRNAAGSAGPGDPGDSAAAGVGDNGATDPGDVGASSDPRACPMHARLSS